MTDSMSRRTFLGAAGAAGAATLAAGGLAGAADALASEAEGTEAQAEETVDPASIADARDYDAVVCGAGIAGLVATCRLADAGLKVVCLEKCPVSCAGGSNCGFVNAQAILDAGGEAYDENAYVDDLISKLDGMGDPELYHAFVRANPTVGDYMVGIAEEQGHEYHVAAELSSIDFTDEYGMLEEHIAAKGGEVLYEMAATQLVRDSEGTVTGVAAHDDAADADVLFNAARGVILACGGYSGNADYIRTYIPWLDPDALEQYAPNAALGGEDGDAVAMCLAAGIPIGPAPHMPEVHFVHGAVATEGVLFVDGLGQRIPDSEKCLAHEIRTQIVMRRAGHRTWRLTDGKDGYPEYIPDGLPESMWPDYSEPLDDYETLDELAEAFGFDPEVLAATVEAWNAAVEAGEDDAYGCDLSTAMKLDTPPYHAKECKGASLAMVGGPLVNARMQALGDDYRPVGGLYAVGSSCCGFFGANYPMDLKFGVHRAFAAVSGYLAAEDIVAGA